MSNTVQVKDGTGTLVTVPVLPTNDGNSLPVSALALPLPTGAATAAKQDALVTALAGLLKTDSVVKADGVNRSGTAGTTATTLIPANASRRGFAVQNQGSGSIWINNLGAATADQNSLQIAAGAYFEFPPNSAPTGAISVIAATANTPVYAREW